MKTRTAGSLAGVLAAFALVLATAPGQASEQIAAANADAPTFTKDVAPILYRNCTACHRPGEMAPMSLVTYRDTRPWVKSIRENVLKRAMPPWHADPKHGTFSNQRTLAQAEIDTIVAWADTGARQGDPNDLPAAPTYVEGWTIGTPDAVFEMQDEYEVPAEGVVEYQYFEVPTNLTEDKWVQAIEVRPGSRAVVHHVIVYCREPGQATPSRVISFRRDQSETPPPPPAPDGKPRQPRRLGFSLAAVAGGTEAHVFPEGAAKLVKAGSVLTFQMHYTTNGEAVRDRSRIGVKFAKQPPRHQIRTAFMINGSFVIPAGAPSHRVDAEATFNDDVLLWSLLPHTHLRGKSFEYRVAYPDGRSEVVLSVPKYDFGWQTEYRFAEPLRLPKGTKLEAVAHYDNSAQNPANPDPTVDVRWGDQTFEEMMFTSMAYSVVSEQRQTTAGSQQD